MTDTISQQSRSRIMRSIKCKDTKPEMLVRKALHRMGFRYRLHDKKLPGKPDIVLKKYRTVIFVHGCFWHGHECDLFRWPQTNINFWHEKINANIKRDIKNIELLEKKGWNVIVVWECQMRNHSEEEQKLFIDGIRSFLKEHMVTFNKNKMKN